MDRDLSLIDRKVNTKPSNYIEVFDIDEIDLHFHESLDLIQKQLDHIDGIAKQDVVVAEEILRAQVVFLESAFDFYLHEVIKLGVVAMYGRENGFSPTEKYTNLSFSMSVLEQAVMQQEQNDWLKRWIDDTYVTETYMSYRAFNDVCNLIGVKAQDISSVFYQRGCKIKTIDQLKSALEGLFRHRNRIVHQSDRLSKNAERCPISKEDVEKHIHNIKCIVSEMSKQIKEKQSREDGQPPEEEKTDDKS